MKVVVIIPAFNEEKSIGLVLDDIPRDLVAEVLVVNNNSTDKTADVAERHGATVLSEEKLGYGSACLAGILFAQQYQPDVIVFLDGDYSDHPNEMSLLLDKITDGFDLVIGSRVLGKSEPGALLPQARYGNRIAVCLIRLIFAFKFTDLGPFRAIRWEKLMALAMNDRDFGWTVEMQVKAVRQNLKIAEVPVSYRQRVGISKVTGTFYGTIMAGYKILFTIIKYALRGRKIG